MLWTGSPLCSVPLASNQVSSCMKLQVYKTENENLIYIYIKRGVLIIVSEIRRYRKDCYHYHNLYFVEPVVFVLGASDSR